MGVTISHALGIERKRLKSVLDRTQRVAEEMKKGQATALGISFGIRRPSEFQLLIDIGGCETLAFCFDSYENYVKEAEGGWSYQTAVLSDRFANKQLDTENDEHLKDWPDQRKLWSASFCKTQFASSIIEHKMVADLVRSVAMYADLAYVSDEGDYYHTGVLEDARGAIAEVGAIIGAVGGMLNGLGWDSAQVQKGGETVIKPTRRKAKTKPMAAEVEAIKGCAECRYQPCSNHDTL